ncbi:MAG: helix-turn-helix transcriptional regulator [Leptospira sp.]|nr:helix-turn-helix transcriptional regulator [Leptospira sp.]NCS92914.1 helix-turn-helix transcriptional regulator [Leptospira sp.]
MEIKKLFIFNNSFIYITNSTLKNDFHSHYAISVLISWPNPFSIIEPSGLIQRSQFAVIGSNTKHRIESEKTNLIVAQWDPHEIELNTLSSWIKRNHIHLLSWQRIESLKKEFNSLLQDNFTCEDTFKIYQDIQATLGSSKRNLFTLDNRIRLVCNYIQSNLLDKLNVKVLADLAELSETRFMHVFKEEIGIPVRRYVLWQRLFEAAKQMQKGKSLIETAYDVGFSDQAHLSRTFKDMLGVQPSLFLGGNSGVKIQLCY